MTTNCPCLPDEVTDNWTWDTKDRSLLTKLPEHPQEQEPGNPQMVGEQFELQFQHHYFNDMSLAFRTPENYPGDNRFSAVRGTRRLNGGVFYWEIKLQALIPSNGGCAVGIGSRETLMSINHASDQDFFQNLHKGMLGYDAESWGLNVMLNSPNRGFSYVAHNLKEPINLRKIKWVSSSRHDLGPEWPSSTYYLSRIAKDDISDGRIIGILFDGLAGTLSFYLNGKLLDATYTGLDEIQRPLYPMICVTNEPPSDVSLTLIQRKRSWQSLQSRCRDVIVDSVKSRECIQALPLPGNLQEYVRVLVEPTVITEKMSAFCKLKMAFQKKRRSKAK